jgi:hypothetical protein
MIHFVKTLIQKYSDRKENWKNELLTIPIKTTSKPTFFPQYNERQN